MIPNQYNCISIVLQIHTVCISVDEATLLLCSLEYDIGWAELALRPDSQTQTLAQYNLRCCILCALHNNAAYILLYFELDVCICDSIFGYVELSWMNANQAKRVWTNRYLFLKHPKLRRNYIIFQIWMKLEETHIMRSQRNMQHLSACY